MCVLISSELQSITHRGKMVLILRWGQFCSTSSFYDCILDKKAADKNTPPAFTPPHTRTHAVPV